MPDVSIPHLVPNTHDSLLDNFGLGHISNGAVENPLEQLWHGLQNHFGHPNHPGLPLHSHPQLHELSWPMLTGSDTPCTGQALIDQFTEWQKLLQSYSCNSLDVQQLGIHQSQPDQPVSFHDLAQPNFHDLNPLQQYVVENFGEQLQLSQHPALSEPCLVPQHSNVGLDLASDVQVQPSNSFTESSDQLNAALEQFAELRSQLKAKHFQHEPKPFLVTAEELHESFNAADSQLANRTQYCQSQEATHTAGNGSLTELAEGLNVDTADEPTFLCDGSEALSANNTWETHATAPNSPSNVERVLTLSHYLGLSEESPLMRQALGIAYLKDHPNDPALRPYAEYVLSALETIEAINARLEPYQPWMRALRPENVALFMLDWGTSLCPYVSDGRDVQEAITGYDLVNQEDLALWQRGLAAG